jgi:hypothetical protein
MARCSLVPLLSLYPLPFLITVAQALLVHHIDTVVIPRSPIINNATGHLQVFNSSTEQIIPQAPLSDGAGIGFSTPAILWILFCFLVGIPLALAGIKGRKLTTGASVGLVAAVCCPSLPLLSMSCFSC